MSKNLDNPPYLFHFSCKVCCLALLKSILLQYPGLEPLLDDLLPKKSPMIVVKWLVVYLSGSTCLIIVYLYVCSSLSM